MIVKARYGGADDDYGPCACGNNRATIPVAIPVSWAEDDPERTEILEKNDLFFGGGYDFRRIFGPVRSGEFFLNFSACPVCCQKAVKIGVAEKVEDVGFSTNNLTNSLFTKAGEMLEDK